MQDMASKNKFARAEMAEAALRQAPSTVMWTFMYTRYNRVLTTGAFEDVWENGTLLPANIYIVVKVANYTKELL